MTSLELTAISSKGTRERNGFGDNAGRMSSQTSGKRRGSQVDSGGAGAAKNGRCVRARRTERWTAAPDRDSHFGERDVYAVHIT